MNNSDLLHRKSWYGMLSFLLYCLFLSTGLSQITITQSQFNSNFCTPGGRFADYKCPTSPITVNIGMLGGPNIYDFTSISFSLNGYGNIYQVSQIPQLASRYPSTSIIWGNSLQHVGRNPILLSEPDTMKQLGEAFVSPDSEYYSHLIPPIPSGYPVVYGSTSWSLFTKLDTTYINGVAVRHSMSNNRTRATSIDAYGTLRIPGYDFECLRLKVVDSLGGQKFFQFLTREGVMVYLLTSVASSDTGNVQAQYMMYILGSSIVNDVRDYSQFPSIFSLQQNYPNPFNPTTRIQYTLSSSRFVTLKVYSMLGQELVTLVNEHKEPGNHEVRFDASHFVSGIYYYRLQAGSFTETKALVLIR